jgi:hypothetical protein
MFLPAVLFLPVPLPNIATPISLPAIVDQSSEQSLQV